MNQNITHTIWIFQVGLRGSRYVSMDDVLAQLNTLYLPNCLDPVTIGADTFTITAANAQLAQGNTITPGPFDAVIFLVRDVQQTLVTRLNSTLPADIVNNRMKLGHTTLGFSTGGLAEVFWERCQNSREAAASIFHEAAHLKSNMDNSMHTVKVGGPHGGPGLRVLSALGSAATWPSWDDFEFYNNQIPKRVTLRTQVP